MLFDLTGRTVRVERDGHEVGRRLVAVVLESEHTAYAWLNATSCVGEGFIDPESSTSRIGVFRCVPDV